jgi:MFS family permease
MSNAADLLLPEGAVAEGKAVSQARVFWATWAGWMLDGFDLSIYIFVLVPALTELLQVDGIEATQGNIARYGGYLFTIFMLGWGCSMFWGWLADRIGRVRVMCLTILMYSVSTALCGFAGSISVFAAFRFLSGFGVGGEWAAGTPLLQESVPERTRIRLAGWLHTATPAGILLASLASFLIPYIGWRGLFFLGILPAFLTIYLRLRIPEPAVWLQRKKEANRSRVSSLFARGRARNTWTAALMMSCIIFGLWSSTFWAPTLIINKLMEAGRSSQYGQRMASLSGVLMNVGTLIACLLIPWIVVSVGSRRKTARIFFSCSFIANVVAYAIVVSVYNNVVLFFWLLPVLGFFTNGVFALYTIWLPEIFSTSQRAFGAGLAFSFGRIFGAFGPAIVGNLVALTGSYPMAITVVSAIYLVGLPIIAMAPETAGKGLPT